MRLKQILDNPKMRLVLQGKGVVSYAVGKAALELTSGGTRVLLIATPSANKEDYDAYIAAGKHVFGDRLGVSVDVLHAYGKFPSRVTIDRKIAKADLIWISGGNTQYALNTFRKTGIGAALKKAAPSKVIGGGSAGLLLIGEAGLSYYTPGDGSATFQRTKGLSLAHLFLCPHLNFVEPEHGNHNPRSLYFKKLLKLERLSELALGVDQEAALELSGDTYRVIASHKANGITVYGKKEHHLRPTKNFRSDNMLVRDI